MNVMQALKLGTEGMERGKILATIDGELWVIADTNNYLPKQGIEEARRIVACVNACRGLGTDELEMNGLMCAIGHQLIDQDKIISDLKSAILEFIDNPTGLNKERMRDMCI